ncbi:MAG: AAA family ATPase [Pacificimonas sp.]
MKPVVISGCSGGGKSTLLAELGRRGFATSDEIGRQVVRAGEADPIADPGHFAALVAAREIKRARATDGLVFFDRSLVDQIALARRMGQALPPELGDIAPLDFYHERVIFAPPWPELFAQDAERRHDFPAAMDEYIDLHRVYPTFGFTLIDLPRASVSDRADFVLHALDQPLSLWGSSAS